MQCEDAPCLQACPTAALEKRNDGVIVVNESKCCGNKACVTACPYGAIFINPDTNMAEKCDFCGHRTDLGMEPACVDVCPTEALKYTDWSDPKSPTNQEAKKHRAQAFKKDANTKPRVRYIGLKDWMEPQAKSIQLTPDENELIYEQKK